MKASIKLIDPNTVVRVKPMCYSPQDKIEFTKQINELLEIKLIIQSKSPHMSPAFLVENEAGKRRGKKRMVVNYKKINEATIEDSHNLPNMQELLTLLRGKSIFSSFDCKSGFWQVLLDEQSQLLTAFTCPNG
nr:retrotransposon protein, putative, Ty3-gypsy subclass [Tanacetum cinerariifolium]